MSDQDDPLVMYLIVSKDLCMSIGKTAAQVGHAVGYLFMRYSEIKQSKEGYLFKEWMNKDSCRKIVLGADKKEFDKLKSEIIDDPNCCIVQDAGFTEVMAGSETVIGVFPQYKSQASKTIKRLQSLK